MFVDVKFNFKEFLPTYLFVRRLHLDFFIGVCRKTRYSIKNEELLAFRPKIKMWLVLSNEIKKIQYPTDESETALTFIGIFTRSDS
jgi:hypothetical protein